MDQQPKPENEEKKVDDFSHSPLIPHPDSGNEAVSSDTKEPSQEPSVATQESLQKPLVSQNSSGDSTHVDGLLSSTATPPPPKKGISLPLTIVFLVLAFLCGLLIAGWYFQNQINQVKLTQQKAENVQPLKQAIIIGTNATDPPMESFNEKGALVGYDIDLGYRIANEMGVKAEFKNVDWDIIFKELLDKKIDMIMASVTITDERKKLYAFSDPYVNAGQVIISRKESPITDVASLEGKKIAVQKDTTNEQEAYKHTTKELVQVYAEYADIAKAVSVGSAEAAISDLTIAKGLIGNYENIKISSDPFTNEYYGIVMRKEDTQLQKKVNEALAVLKVNGYLTDLKQKWLD